MLTSILNGNHAKVLSLFIISPGSKFNRKEIKEKTGMNNVPLDKSLASLANLNVLIEERGLYSLNHEDPMISEILKLIKEDFKQRLNSLPLKIFYTLLDLEEKFLEIRGIKSVILFGSYAKLIYTDRSDIDLAIITKNKWQKGLEKKVNRITDKIAEKQDKEIQAHFFSEEDMKHKEDALIKDIMRNGRILMG